MYFLLKNNKSSLEVRVVDSVPVWNVGQYKRQTHKRRTSTNVGQVHLQEKTSDLVDFEWTIVLKMSNYEFYKIIQFNPYIFATRCCRP